jgi:type VI secretion system protein ImpF
VSRVDPNQGLMPSILDRLIDPDSAGTASRYGYGVEQMIDAVRRDLEDLLNTRQSHMGLPEEYKQVYRSIYTYGLPDLTQLNAITPQQRRDIGRQLEACVSLFEPRLKNVKATMVDAGDGKERCVRFRIEARLTLGSAERPLRPPPGPYP